jgi:hypothetical protein
MSSDLAVWKNTFMTLSDGQAAEVYASLCNGSNGVGPAAPEVEAFYSDLTRKYPEIDTYSDDEIDAGPWSCLLSRSGNHVQMSMVWSRAEEIGAFVFELAKKHDLLLYDPQRGIVWRVPHPP